MIAITETIQTAPENLPADFQEPKKTTGGRVTIAIVDGDQPMRALLAKKIIQAKKFCCAGLYPSGRCALDHLPVTSPAMVLIEMNLPDMSGLECLRRLKPLLPDTKFVVLTASDAPEDIFSALSAGASGYLLKGSPGDEVLSALHHIQLRDATLRMEIAGNILRRFRPADLRPAILEQLSARQFEVLELLAQGKTDKEIANHLHITFPTVSTHCRRLFDKLQVKSRAHAVAIYGQSRISGEVQ